ncbi:MAG: hypothetical protein M5U22_01140 [Thermoleophilia bacterium]|nr:hypothetical protein [Thermoleophilia bacterium]
MARPAVYYHPRFLDHNTGDHPEAPERLVAAREAILASKLEVEWVTPRPAPVEAVERVHDAAYVTVVRRMSQTGGGRLDWDTVVSPASYEAALLAVGAGIEAVERARAGGSAPCCWCGLPGTTPAGARGWASASSTTSRRRPRTRWRSWAWRGC